MDRWIFRRTFLVIFLLINYDLGYEIELNLWRLIILINGKMDFLLYDFDDF